MSSAERAELFAEAAGRRRLPDALVEKDFWVCWVLGQLFSTESLKRHLLFKGGTSLSKVFNVIQRFSEDIDIAVDYSLLGFTGGRDPLQPRLSKTKRNKLLESMMVECQRYVAGDFLRELQARCIAVLGSDTAWELSIDPNDAHVVRFRYPEGVQSSLTYIAPMVILELGTHAELIPRGEFPVRSILAEEFTELFDEPSVLVNSILAKRTFWEKATILHAEFHRPMDKPMLGRHSRHYYDVAMLAQSSIKDEALADLGLLASVVKHKQIFYPSAWARYDLAVPGSLRLSPPVEREAELRRDYQSMSVMIFGKQPAFDDVLATLNGLQDEINENTRKD